MFTWKIEALLTQERVSAEQQKAVSRVLMTNTSFEDGCEHNATGKLQHQTMQVVTHTHGAADNIG